MATSLLIDTCVLIDFLRGHAGAFAFMSSIPGRPAVSVMTITELYVGAGRGGDESRIARLLDGFEVRGLDADIARAGGRLRRHYGPSHGVGIIDALIAATAQAHGARLVTRNTRHFPMLDDLMVPYA